MHRAHQAFVMMVQKVSFAIFVYLEYEEYR